MATYPQGLPWLLHGAREIQPNTSTSVNYEFGGPRVRDIALGAKHKINQGDIQFTANQLEVFQRFFQGVGSGFFDGYYLVAGKPVVGQVRLLPTGGKLYDVKPVSGSDLHRVSVKLFVANAVNPRADVVDAAIALNDYELNTLEDRLIEIANNLEQEAED